MKLPTPLRIAGIWILLWAIISIPGLCAPDNLQAFSLGRPLTVRWKSEPLVSSYLHITSDAETIYQSQSNGDVIALQAESGSLLWRTEVGGQITSLLTSPSGVVYVTSQLEASSQSHNSRQSSGVIRALSRESGITLWVRALPVPFRSSLVLAHATLFVGTAVGRIYAINQETGEIVWSSQQQSSPVSHLFLGDKTLFGITDSGVLSALDQLSGKVAWRYRTQPPITDPIVAPTGILLFGSTDGYVNAFSLSGGRVRTVWRKRAGTGVQTTSLSHNGLVVTTSDNFAYLFSLKKGARLWKRQLPGRLAGQPLITSDGVLFALEGENACIALSLQDGRQINTIFVGDDNAVVSDPTLAKGLLIIPTRAGLFAFAPVN